MVESDDKCQNCWWPLLELVMTIVKIDDENDDYSDKDDNDDKDDYADNDDNDDNYDKDDNDDRENNDDRGCAQWTGARGCCSELWFWGKVRWLPLTLPPSHPLNHLLPHLLLISSLISFSSTSLSSQDTPTQASQEPLETIPRNIWSKVLKLKSANMSNILTLLV